MLTILKTIEKTLANIVAAANDIRSPIVNFPSINSVKSRNIIYKPINSSGGFFLNKTAVRIISIDNASLNDARSIDQPELYWKEE